MATTISGRRVLENVASEDFATRGTSGAGRGRFRERVTLPISDDGKARGIDPITIDVYDEDLFDESLTAPPVVETAPATDAPTIQMTQLPRGTVKQLSLQSAPKRPTILPEDLFETGDEETFDIQKSTARKSRTSSRKPAVIYDEMNKDIDNILQDALFETTSDTPSEQQTSSAAALFLRPDDVLRNSAQYIDARTRPIVWKAGKIPEWGRDIENTKQYRGTGINKHHAPEYDDRHVEFANLRKAFSFYSNDTVKDRSNEPIEYTFKRRMNKINDPSLDPSNPMYDYNKWFNTLLNTRFTRLIKPEDYKRGSFGMYYPFDTRRYVLRNPIADPELLLWVNSTLPNHTLSGEAVKSHVHTMQKIREKGKPDPRNTVYLPTGDRALGQEIFDLLHLSDQYMMHEYTDPKKQAAYLDQQNPYDTHFKNFLTLATSQFKPLYSQHLIVRNPYVSHGMNGHELHEMKQFIGRIKKKDSAPKEKYFDMCDPAYDSILDLHRKLFKSRPINGKSLLKDQFLELKRTEKFIRDKDIYGDWMLRAIADTKRTHLPLVASTWAPHDPFAKNNHAMHYGLKTFDNNQHVLSVLPEAKELLALRKS